MSNMTINGGNALANTHGIEGTEHANLPGRTTNFVSQQVAEQYANNQTQQSDHKPTDGSRECTEPKGPSWEDIQSSLKDRLANNSEYQDLKKLQDGMSQVEQDFNLLMQNHFTVDDGFLTYADLMAVSNDGRRPQYVRDAANRLLANNRAWMEITGADGRASGAEVAAFRERLGSAMRNIEKTEEDQVRTDLGAVARTPANGSKDPATGAGETNETPRGDKPPEASTETPKPPPSTRPGTEGALENLANGQDWIQKEIERLANEAAKDPAKAPALQARISMLQNQFQVLANMSTQINQMMSNITKMWSDIAMNSVRNIK